MSAHASPRFAAGLLAVAAFGLVVPNGLFVYWLLNEFSGVRAVLENRLALAFMIDALMVVGLLSLLFARRPPGPVRWPWFVVLSIVGGLGFSIPFFYWLNLRRAGPERDASVVIPR